MGGGSDFLSSQLVHLKLRINQLREGCVNTHISLNSAVTTATEQSSLTEARRGELQTDHNIPQICILHLNKLYTCVEWRTNIYCVIHSLYLSEENISLETLRLWTFDVCLPSNVWRSWRVTRPNSSPDITHTHIKSSNSGGIKEQCMMGYVVHLPYAIVLLWWGCQATEVGLQLGDTTSNTHTWWTMRF